MTEQQEYLEPTTEFFAFPFVGAGARVQQYAPVRVFISFAAVPSAPVQALVQSWLPTFLDCYAWTGRTLIASSSRPIGDIVSAYDDCQVIVNKSIERSILQVHSQLAAIDLAFRSGDRSSSSWHRWSVGTAMHRLHVFDAALDDRDPAMIAALSEILVAADDLGVVVPLRYHNLLCLGEREALALAKADSELLRELVQRHTPPHPEVLHALGNAFDAHDPEQRSTLVSIGELLLTAEVWPMNLAVALTVACAAVLTDDDSPRALSDRAKALWHRLRCNGVVPTRGAATAVRGR